MSERTIFDTLDIDVLAHTDICLARAMRTGRTLCGNDRCVPERGSSCERLPVRLEARL